MLITALLSAGLLAPAGPPISHRLPLASGDTLAVTEVGSGARAVVIVPGLLGNSFGYRRIAPALADSGFRVLIIEPLGTGASARPRHVNYTLEAQAERLRQALRALDAPPAHFVCHSVSASICMRLALLEPAAVKGIVSLNGGPDERGGTQGLRAALRFAPLIKLFGARRILRGKIRDGLRQSSFDPAWVNDSTLEGYTRPLGDVTGSLRTLHTMAEAVEPDSLRPRLHQLAPPLLLLVGAGSRTGAIGSAEVQALAAEVPRFQVDSIPRAGQYIHEERPDAVITRVLEFIRRFP